MHGTNVKITKTYSIKIQLNSIMINYSYIIGREKGNFTTVLLS